MFDYDNTDGPDIDTIRSVAAEMANAGNPPPMSDTEREEWRAWREQQEWLAEHQRRECERQQAEAAAEQEREARRQAAIAKSERDQRLREEMHQRANRQMRDRQLADLHSASIRQEQLRSGLMRSAAYAASRESLSRTLNDYMALKYPSPPPEPTVVVVSEDDGSADLGSRNFDVAKWAKKPRSWF